MTFRRCIRLHKWLTSLTAFFISSNAFSFNVSSSRKACTISCQHIANINAKLTKLHEYGKEGTVLGLYTSHHVFNICMLPQWMFSRHSKATCHLTLNFLFLTYSYDFHTWKLLCRSLKLVLVTEMLPWIPEGCFGVGTALAEKSWDLIETENAV